MKILAVGMGAALLAGLIAVGQSQETARPRDRAGAAAHADHQSRPGAEPGKAVAVLVPVGDSGVSGTITIGRDGKAVVISGTVRGLEPSSRHAFHIHEFGDLSDLREGKSVGDHFNPEGSPHGRPNDPGDRRHVGDLGNIEADDRGVARIELRDELVRLGGPNGVIGRAFVVHAKEDKFTQPSGDAGDRIAFGTIGIAKPDADKAK